MFSKFVDLIFVVALQVKIGKVASFVTKIFVRASVLLQKPLIFPPAARYLSIIMRGPSGIMLLHQKLPAIRYCISIIVSSLSQRICGCLLLLVALLFGLTCLAQDHRHATGLWTVLLTVTGSFPTVTHCALNTDIIIVASFSLHIIMSSLNLCVFVIGVFMYCNGRKSVSSHTVRIIYTLCLIILVNWVLDNIHVAISTVKDVCMPTL